MERRAVALQYAGGLSLGYSQLPFRVALNVIHVRLDHTLSPETNYPYRRYYPSGKDFPAASLSYAYIHPRFQAGGETAITERSRPIAGDPHGIAVSTSNYVRWKFAPLWSVVVFTREKLAEAVHAEKYLEAYNNIDAADDDAYYLCPGCGYIHKGDDFEKCPICGVPKAKFQRF